MDPPGDDGADATEPLGAQTLLTGQINGALIRIALNGEHAIPPGTTLRVRPRPDRIAHAHRARARNRFARCTLPDAHALGGSRW